MPPLLLKLTERPLLPEENIHWIGVSYGLTAQLHKFWKRSDFVPVYLRQTMNEITGENTCIMLKSLLNDPISSSSNIEEKDWLKLFSLDFSKRFLQLLSYEFKKLHPVLCLSILEATKVLTTSTEFS